MNRKLILGTLALGLLVPEGGSALAGPIITSDVVTLQGTVFPVPETPTAPEGGPFLLTTVSSVPDGAVLLVESAGSTVVSDQIYVSQGQLFFASDPNLANLSALGVPIRGTIVEDGTLQDVGALLNIAPGVLFVQSDVNDVPEPTSIVLAGFGALGLAGYALRRRKLAIV